MDNYKLKWTKIQQGIIEFLFKNLGERFTQREISRQINASPTAVGKSLKLLEKEEIVKKIWEKNINLSLIELNLENRRIFEMKRVENLRLVYNSGLANYLEENFPGKTIILFGSYSKGEDTKNSDIDIAILYAKEKKLNLKKYEEELNKEIQIQFYKSLKNIHKNLKENLFNGIVLSGGFSL